MKLKVLTIMVALLPLLALAQSEEAGFTADRPGATTGVDVLPKGRVQWETGFGYERTKVVEDVAVTTWTVNSSLLRWGISESAELRLQDYILIWTTYWSIFRADSTKWPKKKKRSLLTMVRENLTTMTSPDCFL